MRLLSVFDAVLTRGGIRAAATVLNISRPAVSQAILKLEEHLGAELLDRSRRPSVPTRAGLILHGGITEGLGRIGDAVEEVARLSAPKSRSVTVACALGFATHWLMPRLASFYLRHPDVAVNVVTTLSGEPLLGPTIDIALRFGDGAWTDGRVHHLFDEWVSPVCHPALAERIERDQLGLAEVTLIHVETDHEAWTGWSHYLKAQGRPSISKGRGLQFSNYVQATQAALAGQGVMLGWTSLTDWLVEDGQLMRLTNQVVQGATYIVSAPRAAQNPSTALMEAWLIETAQATPGGRAPVP